MSYRVPSSQIEFHPQTLDQAGLYYGDITRKRINVLESELATVGGALPALTEARMRLVAEARERGDLYCCDASYGAAVLGFAEA